MYPKARRSVHLLPFPTSRPTGVGAFVEQKIIKKNMEATLGSLGEKDKITLEAHRNSHAQADGNNSSIKVKGDQNRYLFKTYFIDPHQILPTR